MLKKKYSSLAPRAEYLCDSVVLAQAWKKAHNYIRRHNWYADTLELDCSAVDLESRLNEWSQQLTSGSYDPGELRLIPAPKNAPWRFDPKAHNGWGPIKENVDEKLYLRPLAHLGIREQTASTAVMLCLADCIETAQGNTDQEVEIAQADGVYRLF